ncbi:MAG: CPBP family intramembrane glutamic endopeptidase [Candidatus Nanopelagicales bacterium]
MTNQPSYPALPAADPRHWQSAPVEPHHGYPPGTANGTWPPLAGEQTPWYGYQPGAAGQQGFGPPAPPLPPPTTRAVAPLSYLDRARSGRSGWWYLLGVGVIMFTWMIGQALFYIGADVLLPDRFGDLLPTLFSFLPLFLITPLVVRVVHGRPWRSLITPFPRVSFTRAWGGFASYVTLMLLVSVPATILDSDGLRWGTSSWASFFLTLVLAVTLLPIQTTAEELFFRGYLMQWLSLGTRRPVLLSSINGLLFAFAHMANPEVAALSGAAVLLAPLPYFAIGYAFGWISVRSGTLELSIGAHWANNLVVTTLLGVSDSALPSTALVTDTSPNFLLSTICSIAIAWLFCWWHTRPGRIGARPA